MGFGGPFVMGDSDAPVSLASLFTDFTPGIDADLQWPALATLYASL